VNAPSAHPILQDAASRGDLAKSSSLRHLGTMTVAERLGTALADRYRIERELGAGGMATVYLARTLGTAARSR